MAGVLLEGHPALRLVRHRRVRLAPDEVCDDRRRIAAVEGAGAVEDGRVGDRAARMLAQMLEPGVDQEQLDPALRRGKILVEAPARGAVAAAYAAHRVHGML